MHMAAVESEATVLFDTVSYMGKPYEDPVQVACKFVPKLGRTTKVQVSVERIGPSQYQINYTPTTIKGAHLLYIKVDGQDIRESPFSVLVVKTLDEMQGYPIHILTELQGPAGVAVNHRGEVFVSEREGHCISVFSPRGERLHSFPTQNLRQGKVKCPHGVAIDDDGNIFMAVTKAHRIYSFTSVGKACRSPFRFHCPKCIALNNHKNKIYVADDNDCIHILNSDLTLVTTFGKYGRDKEEFDDICGIACSSTGRVYVADSGNKRIQVFTAEGMFLRMFGTQGLGQGEMNFPVSIAVDSAEVVYICEQDNCRISLFTSDGRFITSFGQRGCKPGEFMCPSGIAVDASRTLYVCDATAQRVQAFSCKHVHTNLKTGTNALIVIAVVGFLVFFFSFFSPFLFFL